MKSLLVFALILVQVPLLQAQNKPDSLKNGQYVLVNGAKLWVILYGKGDPLFIIPGGPGSAHTSYRRFDSLAGICTLIYFDAFGRGKSDTAKNPAEYSLGRDIDDIEGLRKALNLDTINVLGHSYGGLVAQGYALKYPDHLKHLVLANTFHSYLMWQENDDNSNREIRTNYPEVWDTLMKIRQQGFVSSDPLHQEIYSRVPYGFLYAYNPDHFVPKAQGKPAAPYPNPYNTKLYYQMVGRDGDFIVGSDIGSFDYRKKLKSLKMPVLIYGGRYDRVAVPWMMVQFREYCPQARFVMFEKSGHNPQVEESQKLFILLSEFLGH